MRTTWQSVINVYTIAYKNLDGDLKTLAEAYARYCNKTRNEESPEALEIELELFLETCAHVLDNYVFAVNPDWL